MLRTLLIIVTAASTLVGSFGLTSYRHICEMMGVMKTVDAACAMCAHDKPSDGVEISATPCCSITATVYQTDESFLTRIEIPIPLLQSAFLPPVLAHLMQTTQQPGLAVRTSESPPPFALRGQSTYLVNSVFLI